MREFYPIPETMLRAVLGPGGRFHLETVPTPELAPGDLLFRLLAAGLTPEDVDLSRNLGRTPSAVPVGEVAAVGDAVSGWNPLDRGLVTVPSDPEPSPALEGLSEYVYVPESLAGSETLHKIPPELPLEDSTLLPAAALAARVLREAQTERRSSLLVIGLGVSGQIAVRMARHQGLRWVFAAGVSPTLRQRAEWSGATRVIRVPETPLIEAVRRETNGTGIEAAVVFSPDASLAHAALQSLAPRGTLVLGAPFSSSFLFALPGSRLQRLELRIQGVNGFHSRDFRAARQALRQGIVNAETLVSKRIAWTQLPQAEVGPAYWEHGTHIVVEGPDGD